MLSVLSEIETSFAFTSCMIVVAHLATVRMVSYQPFARMTSFCQNPEDKPHSWPTANPWKFSHTTLALQSIQLHYFSVFEPIFHRTIAYNKSCFFFKYGRNNKSHCGKTRYTPNFLIILLRTFSKFYSELFLLSEDPGQHAGNCLRHVGCFVI